MDVIQQYENYEEYRRRSSDPVTFEKYVEVSDTLSVDLLHAMKVAGTDRIDTIDDVTEDDAFESCIVDSIIAGISDSEQRKTTRKMMLAAKIADAMHDRGYTNTTFMTLLGVDKDLLAYMLSGTYSFSVDQLLDIEIILGIDLISV